MLPGGGERGGHLAHARVAGAQPGVDFLQQLRLLAEGRRGDRVLVAVEVLVGARGRGGKRAGIAALDRRDGVGGAQQRGFGKLARMGVAGRLAGHRAQPETLVGVEVGGLQPAIVEHQRFALAVLEIEFAVVGAVDRVGDDRADAIVRNVELSEDARSCACRRSCAGSSLTATDVGAEFGCRFGNAPSVADRQGSAAKPVGEALEVDRDADAFLGRLEDDEGRRLCRSSACRAAASRGSLRRSSRPGSSARNRRGRYPCRRH